MRNFGFAGYDDVQYIGINGKMSEVSADMGLTQLEELETIIAANDRNYTHYAALLDAVHGLRMIKYAESERQNYQYIVVELDPEVTGISRDDLVRVLHAENVLARRYFYPGCHQMEPYRSYFPHAGLLLPHTNLLVQRVMSLPNGIAITPADIEVIAGLIAFIIAHGPEIARRLHDSPDHALS